MLADQDFTRTFWATPLDRISDPVDVVGTVVFLAPPAAAQITGANILVVSGLVGSFLRHGTVETGLSMAAARIAIGSRSLTIAARFGLTAPRLRHSVMCHFCYRHWL